MKPAPPPPLELVTPRCPICGDHTEYDDGFRCRTCQASWSHRGVGIDDGTWDEAEAEQCDRMLTNHNFPVLSGRCIKPIDHGHAEHSNGDSAWTAESLPPWSTETRVKDVQGA